MEPTIVSTSTGGISIAYDYSVYLERIATALEAIVESIQPTPVQDIVGAGVKEVTFNGPISVEGTPTITISAPDIFNGTTATASLVLNEFNTVTNIVLEYQGKGYINSPIYTITDNTGVKNTGTTVLEFFPNLFTTIANAAAHQNNINANIEKIAEASTTTGIRTYGSYDWIKPLEMISWYGQGFGPNSVSTSTVNQLANVISSLTNVVSKYE